MWPTSRPVGATHARSRPAKTLEADAALADEPVAAATCRLRRPSTRARPPSPRTATLRRTTRATPTPTRARSSSWRAAGRALARPSARRMTCRGRSVGSRPSRRRQLTKSGGRRGSSRPSGFAAKRNRSAARPRRCWRSCTPCPTSATRSLAAGRSQGPQIHLRRGPVQGPQRQGVDPGRSGRGRARQDPVVLPGRGQDRHRDRRDAACRTSSWRMGRSAPRSQPPEADRRTPRIPHRPNVPSEPQHGHPGHALTGPQSCGDAYSAREDDGPGDARGALFPGVIARLGAGRRCPHKGATAELRDGRRVHRPGPVTSPRRPPRAAVGVGTSSALRPSAMAWHERPAAALAQDARHRRPLAGSRVKPALSRAAPNGGCGATASPRAACAQRDLGPLANLRASATPREHREHPQHGAAGRRRRVERLRRCREPRAGTFELLQERSVSACRRDRRSTA